MNRENSEKTEPHKLALNLSKGLDLRSSNKKVAFQKLSIYYKWRNMRQEYKNNKIKRIDQMWNDELESTDGSYSVSDMEDYVKYIIAKHETSSNNPPIHIHINRTDNRLVFKIKDGFKLELPTPVTMRLFGSTKKIDRQENE